jgi:hypothetical protein
MPAKKRRRRAPATRTPAVAETAVAEPVAAPARRFRPVSKADADRDARWNATGLLVLLGLVFLLQIPIGVIINITSHTNPLIIDVFFFQPQYLVLAAVLVMPLARRISGQPRNLRLLESLSIGIMYALLSLMLVSVFVHPASASMSAEQFLKQLKLSDGLLIAVGDVLALFGTVALYPGFSRLLGAPGRRARARMLERSAAGPRATAPPSRAATGGAKPRR